MITVEGHGCGTPTSLYAITDCPRCKSRIVNAVCDMHSDALRQQYHDLTFRHCCKFCEYRPVNLRIEGHPRASYAGLLPGVPATRIPQDA